MATGNIANTDSTGNLLSLLTALKGTSSSQSTTISPEGLTALINQTLSGNQGLAAISQGQKSAGLYNSSTNQLLINDLMTRTAAAAAASSSTTTKVNNPQVSKNNVLDAALLLGGKSLLGSSTTAATKKLGIDKWGDNIRDSLGLGPNNGSGQANFVGPPSELSGGIGDSLSSYGATIPTAGGEDLPVDSLNFSSGGTDAVGASDLADSVTSSAGDSAEEEGGSDLLSSVGSLFG